MMPGPLAALTYATIKVAGCAGFAYALNRVLDRNVRISKFGFAKTGIGLACGVLPIRVAIWGAVLAIFYGYRHRRGLVVSALFVGVLWSYLLDGAMALFYHVPGMAMAIC